MTDVFAECFLLVPDLEAARTFYVHVLGLPVDTERDGAITFDLNGTTLKLQEDYPEDVRTSFNLPTPPAGDRGSGAMIALELDDNLDDVHERVRHSDGTVLHEPRTVPWLEDRMFLATDPDGYTLELRE